CFSTSSPPFEADTGYTKFTAYTFLNHKGDFIAAARALAAGGYEEETDVANPLPVPLDKPNEAPDDPHRLARLFAEKHCRHGEELALHFWRSEWHRWDRAAYRVVPEKEVRANLCGWVKGEFDRVNLEELKEYQRRAKEKVLRRGEEVPTVRRVTQGLVGNVMQALTGGAGRAPAAP